MRVPVDILRSPRTGEPLRPADGQLVVQDGNESYPVVDGVPVLIDPERSVFDPRDVIEGRFVEHKVGRMRRTIRAMLPSKGTPHRMTELYRAFVREIQEGSASVRVLVVGGGRLGDGMHPLLEAPDVNVIDTDVYLSPRVQVVCDGHALPFADATFDGVVVQAVLEHVLDPQRVVSEIHRVLRPRGVVLADTPFMQQVHEGAYDFTRWTESGHRRLFRMFDAIETGASSGPATALLWSLCYFARALPRRRGRLVVILDKATLCLFFWLKHVDRLLLSHAAATDGACGVFFLGRRSERAVSDAEVVAGYAGAVGQQLRH